MTGSFPASRPGCACTDPMDCASEWGRKEIASGCRLAAPTVLNASRKPKGATMSLHFDRVDYAIRLFDNGLLDREEARLLLGLDDPVSEIRKTIETLERLAADAAEDRE